MNGQRTHGYIICQNYINKKNISKFITFLTRHDIKKHKMTHIYELSNLINSHKNLSGKPSGRIHGPKRFHPFNFIGGWNGAIINLA